MVVNAPLAVYLAPPGFVLGVQLMSAVTYKHPVDL